MAISMEAMLASLSDGERAFLFSPDGEVERLLSPRGFHEAVVWSSTVTTSPVLVEQLFPGAPLVHNSIDMPGAAMVEDVAHVVGEPSRRRFLRVLEAGWSGLLVGDSSNEHLT